MDSIKINWVEEKPNIAQVYSRGMQYALVNDDNEQIGSPVYCKDFFQDVYAGYYSGTATEIYQYKYDPDKDPKPSLRRAKFLIVNRYDNDFSSKAINSLEFLNLFEKALRIAPTKLYKVENAPEKYKSGAFVFEGSKWWISSPVMLSLYTLCIRVGMVHSGNDFMKTINDVIAGTIKPYQDSDASQLKNGLKGINWILECGVKKLFKDPKNNFIGQNISFLHNNCGIVGFSSKEAKEGFKFWYDRLNKVRRDNKREQGIIEC